METPNSKEIVSTLKKGGALMGGLVAAHLLKEGLMTTSFTPDKTEPMVPDSTVTNGGALAAALAGAIFVKQPELQLALLGAAAFFGIRTLNKVTDGLTGLGAEGEENNLKALLQKYVPNLRGFGNTDMPGAASDDALYNRILNLPPQNYSVGNDEITPINGTADQISSYF